MKRGFNIKGTNRNFVVFRDRIRTTNNVLSDCYAAAVVEVLSRDELVALDAASSATCPNMQVTSKERLLKAEQNEKNLIFDSVVVEMSNANQWPSNDVLKV